MAKSDNLLAILWMLRSRRRMTAAQISEELEVDVRTVYRYIDALSMSGAPIIAEPGPSGGYALLDTFRDTPLFFSTAERIALAHAGLFARQAGYPYSADLAAALTKVERHLSPEQLEHLQQHTEGLDVVDTVVHDEPFSVGEDVDRPAQGDVPTPTRPRGTLGHDLKVIEGAVADRRRLTISHYREITKPPVERRVDPYGLIYWREQWYLVGYCHLRTDIRMFRCDRIASIAETQDHFERPPGFSARELFLQTMVPTSALRDSVTIRLRGTPYAIDSLTRHWFFANFITERSETEIGLSVDVELASDYLPYEVLSCAGEMTVVEPKELRDLVARLAQRILETHESSGD